MANLLPALMQVGNAEIVAVCDASRERAARAARVAGTDRVYVDYLELLDSGEIDAVVLACPPSVHYDVALAAMARGVHVFAEKPPCITSGQLATLIDAANKSACVTGVGLNFRFATPVLRLREVVASPRFGPLVHFEIRHPANKPKAPMWEADTTLRSFLLAQAIHSIDLALLLGGECVEAESEVRAIDDSLLVRIHFRFEGGASGTVLTGNIFPYFDLELMAVGARSSVVALDKMWNLTVKDAEGDAVFGLADAKRWRSEWHPSPLDSGYARSGYLGELQRFFDAIERGEAFPADFRAMQPTYRVIDLVTASVRTQSLPEAVHG
jgi:predicted dehydrogenase